MYRASIIGIVNIAYSPVQVGLLWQGYQTYGSGLWNPIIQSSVLTDTLYITCWTGSLPMAQAPTPTSPGSTVHQHSLFLPHLHIAVSLHMHKYSCLASSPSCFQFSPNGYTCLVFCSLMLMFSLFVLHMPFSFATLFSPPTSEVRNIYSSCSCSVGVSVQCVHSKRAQHTL